MQSLISPMYETEEVHPDDVHVLEVVPAEAGKSTEKVVIIAPFLGRHLLKHQVRRELGWD